MKQVSITSTESFAARAQRSELRRIVLWVFTLVLILVLVIVRRKLGGEVMSSNAVFYPTVMILSASIGIQIGLLFVLVRASRRHVLLSNAIWKASAGIDLLVPAALLLVNMVESPRGAMSALGGPSVLLFPIVILLSVLRLKPGLTLITGLAAGALHALLTARALSITDSHQAEFPVYFSYGVLLGLLGLAGMLVAREVRGHVREASEEAAAHERAQREIAVVNRDLAVAREIQRGLLPAKSPNFDGFDIAGLNTPADQTGGDYYDWQELPGGKLVAVMADVTGHGIGPALVMAVCRAYARASARVIDEPVSLMVRLNELISADLPDDRFITLAIAILQSSGAVELLSAGHGPTLLYQKSTGQITQFGGDGLPLGVFPDETYGPTATFTMQSGDVLVMLTDGFFEWKRPGDHQEFGIERLHETLRTCVEQSSSRIIETFDRTVRAFAAGTPQSDDMTVVVIKRL